MFAWWSLGGDAHGLAAVPVLTSAKGAAGGHVHGRGVGERSTATYSMRASYFDEILSASCSTLTTLGEEDRRFLPERRLWQRPDSGRRGAAWKTPAQTRRRRARLSATAPMSALALALVAAQPGRWWFGWGLTRRVPSSSANPAPRYGGTGFQRELRGLQGAGGRVGRCGNGVVVSQVVPYAPSRSAVVREYQQRMKETGDAEYDFSSMEGF